MRCVSTISRHPPSSSELGSAHLVVEQENVAVPMLQVRPPELFWNKTTCQKHLNIHTTLPALLLPGTIKKWSSKIHCPSGNTLYDFFLHMILSSTRTRFCLQRLLSDLCPREISVPCLPFKLSSLSPVMKRWGMKTCQSLPQHRAPTSSLPQPKWGSASGTLHAKPALTSDSWDWAAPMHTQWPQVW